MDVRRNARSLISIAALAVSACSSTSEGLDFKLEHEVEQARVTFDWRGRNDVSGDMTASFADGRLFTGTYFVDYDNGKILSSLDGTNGEYLRCRFNLMRPSSGMSGGGEGKCRLTDGRKIAARIPPAAPKKESVAERH